MDHSKMVKLINKKYVSVSEKDIPLRPVSIIDIEYIKAVVKYWNWKFLIYPKEGYSVSPEWEFEIEVSHKEFWGTFTMYEDEKITSMDLAIQRVKYFINNELQ